MILHTIAGLPRAGTTLLCNILNQNPTAFATSTSCLPGFVRALTGVASNRIEFKNLLEKQPHTRLRFLASVRAFCAIWHSHEGREHVFDKSRGWTDVPDALRDISPAGIMIVCVRDLRAVYASVEIEERKNGLLSTVSTNSQAKYAAAFSDDGVIGSPYRAVCDLIELPPSNVIFVQYEQLVAEPAKVMEAIYIAAGMEPFAHDFDNVPDTAIDCDGHYLGKFPHRASGKVEARDPHWSKVIPKSVACDIMQKAESYNAHFGYGQAVESEPESEPEDDCDCGLATPAERFACAKCGAAMATISNHSYGVGHVCDNCVPKPLTETERADLALEAASYT